MSRFLLAALLLFTVTCLGACDDDDLPTDPSPPPTEIESEINGTLTQNGAQSFVFTVTRAGQITAQITALTPENAIISLSLGTWTPNACQILLANDAAVLNTTMIGSATTAGTFCIRLLDPGTLSGPVDFTVALSHF